MNLCWQPRRQGIQHLPRFWIGRGIKHIATLQHFQRIDGHGLQHDTDVAADDDGLFEEFGDHHAGCRHRRRGCRWGRRCRYASDHGSPAPRCEESPEIHRAHQHTQRIDRRRRQQAKLDEFGDRFWMSHHQRGMLRRHHSCPLGHAQIRRSARGGARGLDDDPVRRRHRQQHRAVFGRDRNLAIRGSGCGDHLLEECHTGNKRTVHRCPLAAPACSGGVNAS